MEIKSCPWAAAVLILILLGAAASAQEKLGGVYGSGPEVFTLATGSPGEVGLLKALGEAFSQEEGGKTSLHWIKAGSGESLNLLKAKKVDLIMVHAPQAEKQAVAGWLGHEKDLDRLQRVFHRRSGQRPGPDQRGQKRHRRLSKDRRGPGQIFLPGGQLRHPQEGNGHLAGSRAKTRRGLVRGHQGFHDRHAKNGPMTKRATSWWTAAPGWRKRKISPTSQVLFKGDKTLVNTYHALVQPAGATPGAATAARFVDFTASPQGQQIIRDYGRDQYGEGLYNDAQYAKQYDD